MPSRRVRDAVSGLHPVVVVRLVEHANPGEGLQPVGRESSRAQSCRTGNPLSIGSGSPFIE